MTAAPVQMLHVEHDPADLAYLPLDRIEPNPFQPRTTGFTDEDLAELVDSIRGVGVLTPVHVRPVEADRWQLIAGERRVTAARAAGLTHIPALVSDCPDQEMLRLAVIENVQREDLNLIDEAHAYKTLLDATDCTQADVADLVGKSRQHVGFVLALLRLTPAVRNRVAAGVLSFGHAKLLMGIRDPYAAEVLADRIVTEGLSVAATNEIILMGNLPGPEGDPQPRRAFRASSRPAGLPRVSDALTLWLETRVTVVAGQKKGRIVVEFSDMEDLDRLLAQLNVPSDLLQEP